MSTTQNRRGYQLIEESEDGKIALPMVYFDRRAAELFSEHHSGECFKLILKPVKVRVVNNQEGFVGKQYVKIYTITAQEMLVTSALRKLTREEWNAVRIHLSLKS